MGLDLAEAVVSAMTGAAQVACSLLDLARRAAEGIEMVIVTNALDYEAASIAAILASPSVTGRSSPHSTDRSRCARTSL